MRRKSIFILVACLMAVFMSGAAVACSDKNPDSAPDTPPISDSGTPDVEENRAYWLKVNYESLELLKGETFSLGAKLYLGTTAVEGVAFTWQSENPSIASVNNSGLVTAEGEGETKIVKMPVPDGSIFIPPSEKQRVQAAVKQAIPAAVLQKRLQTR